MGIIESSELRAIVTKACLSWFERRRQASKEAWSYRRGSSAVDER